MPKMFQSTAAKKKAESIMKHTKSIHRGGMEKKKKKRNSIFILRNQVCDIIVVILCKINKALSMLASIQESIMLPEKHVHH